MKWFASLLTVLLFVCFVHATRFSRVQVNVKTPAAAVQVNSSRGFGLRRNNVQVNVFNPGVSRLGVNSVYASRAFLPTHFHRVGLGSSSFYYGSRAVGVPLPVQSYSASYSSQQTLQTPLPDPYAGYQSQQSAYGAVGTANNVDPQAITDEINYLLRLLMSQQQSQTTTTTTVYQQILAQPSIAYALNLLPAQQQFGYLVRSFGYNNARQLFLSNGGAFYNGRIHSAAFFRHNGFGGHGRPLGVVHFHGGHHR